MSLIANVQAYMQPSKGGDKAALPCPVNNRKDAVHGTQHHTFWRFRRRLVARWFSALELEADWLSYSKRCCWCGVDARKTKIPAAAKVGAARSDVPRSHVRIAVLPSTLLFPAHASRLPSTVCCIHHGCLEDLIPAPALIEGSQCLRG